MPDFIFFQKTEEQIDTNESRRASHEDGFIVQIDFYFAHGLIPPE